VIDHALVALRILRTKWAQIFCKTDLFFATLSAKNYKYDMISPTKQVVEEGKQARR
jgi:hypothetical protein